MYYACVENGQLVGVFNYAPEVPESVRVFEVTDEEHQLIMDGTHFFDLTVSKVVPVAADVAERRMQEKANKSGKAFLNDTDWQVLRHIREKALGEPTSMTEEAYLALERERHEISKRIVHVQHSVMPPVIIPEEGTELTSEN